MAYKPKLFTEPPTEAKDDKPPYVFTDQIRVAIDVALAADRPLLVTGQPGVGKSTLARVIAAGLDSRFLSLTVTSRTRLENLQADLDTLQRLADAQVQRTAAGKLPPDWTYLRPGVLWWAFDREGAAIRGATAEDLERLAKIELSPPARLTDPSEGNTASDKVVVLLDEIDKADPDLPNDLLEPLDRRRFSLMLPGRPAVRQAEDTKRIVLILTTNGERELPPAFLRRCVVLDLPEPKSRKNAAGALALEDIAAAHFPDPGAAFAPLFGAVAEEVDALGVEAQAEGRRPPSTAEYLDTLRALKDIPDLRTRTEVWAQVKDLLLRKKPGASDGQSPR